MTQLTCPRCRVALSASPAPDGLLTCTACGARVRPPAARPSVAVPPPAPAPQAIPVAAVAAPASPIAAPAAELADESEAALRASLPAHFPAAGLGRLRGRLRPPPREHG